MTAKPLTHRQRLFADAYAEHGVAERAALAAGYAKTTARGKGSELLAHPAVRAYLDGLMAKVGAKVETTVGRVLEELAIVAFADMVDFVQWGFDPENPEAPQVRLIPSAKLDAAKRRGLIEVSQTQAGVKIKLADKIRALELIGKHLGMFIDKGENPNAPVTVTLNLAGLPTAALKGGC